VEPATVNAERVVGKPYLEIDVDRERAARYGLSIVDVQNTIAMAIGGMAATTTVEGRERYNIRVRYPARTARRPGRDRPDPGGRWRIGSMRRRALAGTGAAARG
jgi:copper/silver efflux system protein